MFEEEKAIEEDNQELQDDSSIVRKKDPTIVRKKPNPLKKKDVVRKKPQTHSKDRSQSKEESPSVVQSQETQESKEDSEQPIQETIPDRQSKTAIESVNEETQESKELIANEPEANYHHLIDSGKPLQSQPVEKMTHGQFSVVFTVKNGVRCLFSDDIRSHLHDPEGFSFLHSGQYLIIKRASVSEGFIPRRQGNKNVIYAKALVEELIETYDLSFDERTSMTFSDVHFDVKNDEPYCLIRMK